MKLEFLEKSHYSKKKKKSWELLMVVLKYIVVSLVELNDVLTKYLLVIKSICDTTKNVVFWLALPLPSLPLKSAFIHLRIHMLPISKQVD